MERLSRRQILQLLGASVVAVHCGPAGGTGDAEDSTSDSELSEGATPTPRQMLDGIDHFVILMMENRSFDHYLGALQRDKDYVNRRAVNGTSGDEFNWSSEDTHDRKRVKIHDAKTYKLHSPPHTFTAAHAQWNDGKNDRFVIEASKVHGHQYDEQPMAFYDRKQIPFYYWLAEHFTLFDNWHASVMGPTIPNRLYLNTGSSAGSENNDPITKNEPETIWDQLRAKGVSAKSYHAGKAGLMAHALPNKTKAGHIPFAKIKEFYADAKSGKLPHVSYIEPDYGVNDDHPSRDIRLGQAFVHTIYKHLAASPQWGKTLLVVLYDEHGGFYDHVSPPAAEDAHPDFRRFGFRVPAFVAGPTVKKGHLATGLHDHTSVLATLALRFGLSPLTKRAEHAATFDHVFDPKLFKKPATAIEVTDPIPLDADALENIGQSSQEELEAAIEDGDIPEEFLDDRPLEERVGEWLLEAQTVGAVTLVK